MKPMPKSFSSFPKLPEFVSSRFFSCRALNLELTKSGIQTEEERLSGRGGLIQWPWGRGAGKWCDLRPSSPRPSPPTAGGEGVARAISQGGVSRCARPSREARRPSRGRGKFRRQGVSRGAKQPNACAFDQEVRYSSRTRENPRFLRARCF